MKNNVVYKVSDESDKLLITAQAALPDFNKKALTGLSIFIVIFLIFYWVMITTNNSPVGMYIFSIFFTVALLWIMIFAIKSIKKTIDWIIEVDKRDKTFESKKDQFKVKFDDIKEIKLTEYVSIFGTVPLLKFILKNGEKSLMFPFDSYNKATELKELIDKGVNK